MCLWKLINAETVCENVLENYSVFQLCFRYKFKEFKLWNFSRASNKSNIKTFTTI